MFNFASTNSKDDKPSIFGGPKAQKTNSTGTGLFGNASGSLFAPLKDGEKPKSLLFGNSSGSGLFGSAGQGGSLFSSKPLEGGSLFNAKNSLFGDPKNNIFAKKPEDENKDKPQEEDGENSDGGVRAPDEPPSLQLEDKTA